MTHNGVRSLLSLPYDLRYTADHTWVGEEDDDLLSVGVTEAFIILYGQPEDIEFTAVEGQSVQAGTAIGRIVSESDEMEIPAPVNGQVIEFNVDLVDAPDVLQDSPYGHGWLMRLRPDDDDALASLLPVDEYESLVDDLDGEMDREEDDEDDEDRELDMELDDEEDLELEDGELERDEPPY